MNKLSIVIPCFNEEATIAIILKKISRIALDREVEVVVVDDGSTDKSLEIIKSLNLHQVLIRNDKNSGKGKSLKLGIEAATGAYILIQDADLEYNPDDISSLLSRLNGKSNVIYGSRYLNRKFKRSVLSPFFLGGRLLTKVINIIYKVDLTDVVTCYKLFPKKLYEDLNMEKEGFEFCTELTLKLLKRNIEIVEVPIQYNPRSKSEGKKIRLLDGLQCLWLILKGYK